MFTFISIMAFGVLLGYPLRHQNKIHKLDSLIHGVVCLLLFLLGLSIGLNKMMWSGGSDCLIECFGKHAGFSGCVSSFFQERSSS